MDLKKIFIVSLLIAFSTATTGLAASKYVAKPAAQTQVHNSATYGYQPPKQQYYSPNQPLYGRIVTVPSGANIPAVTATQISTENLSPNQVVSLNLNQAFYYGNTQIAPAGSIVTGNVVEVTSAKRAGRNAKLRIIFTNISTPSGQNIPITGYIKTSDGSGTIVGGTAMDTTKEYAKDVTIGAGAGAVLGVIGAAVSGGAIGQGAAIMTAVGAGGGLAKSLWDKGGEIVIPANSQIDIQLAQPATISVQN